MGDIPAAGGQPSTGTLLYFSHRGMLPLHSLSLSLSFIYKGKDYSDSVFFLGNLNILSKYQYYFLLKKTKTQVNFWSLFSQEPNAKKVPAMWTIILVLTLPLS